MNGEVKTIRDRVRRYISVLLMSLIFIFSVKAQPAITVPNCVQSSPASYMCNLNPSSPFVYLNIYNTEVPYNVTITYSGSPTALYSAGSYLASGQSYSANISILTGITPLQLSVAQSGSGMISFFFVPNVNNTNGTTLTTYNITYGFVFNVGTTTTLQNVTTTTPTSNVTTTTTVSTPPTTNVSNPITPLYSFASLTLYTNQTYEYPIGIINTGNDNLTILNVLIQGLPPQNAYIQGGVGTLAPGQYAYMTLYINTAGMPLGQYNIVIVYTGEADNKVYNAQTSIDLYVISSLGQNITNTQSTTQQTSPIPATVQLPLQVNYTISSGYLFIQGAYVYYNGSTYYIPNANILVIGPNGQALSYQYPIPVIPGQTYCIYSYAQNYVPFFSCVQAPPRPLCYIISPKGQQYNGNIYYPDGTNVTIQSVYDCNSMQPVLGATFYYNGIPTYSTTFPIQEGQNMITISAPGYSLTNITLLGYTPITVSNLPTTPGEYTIQAQGDFVDQAQLILYEYINGTRVQEATGTGSLTYNFTIGQYELDISGPLINTTTYTIYISPPYIPPPKPSFNITSWLEGNVLYIVIAILAFTLISIIIYRKSSSKGVTELAEKITQEIRKQ
ncbi:MAG: hypothetical protein ACP5GJ_04085 [Nanopusillaceae archaeon]